MFEELQGIHKLLKGMETGELVATLEATSDEPSVVEPLNYRKFFKKDSVTCMICGKAGMKTLKRHLMTAHQIKPTEYKKQFNIPKKQTLVAKAYSDSRKQTALNNNLGAKLAEGRAKAAKVVTVAKTVEAKKPATVKKPVVIKKPVPAK
jgi:predicted transcriptional regulator